MEKYKRTYEPALDGPRRTVVFREGGREPWVIPPATDFVVDAELAPFVDGAEAAGVSYAIEEEADIESQAVGPHPLPEHRVASRHIKRSEEDVPYYEGEPRSVAVAFSGTTGSVFKIAGPDDSVNHQIGELEGRQRNEVVGSYILIEQDVPRPPV